MIVAYICLGLWVAIVLGFVAWAFWDKYTFSRDRAKPPEDTQ